MEDEREWEKTYTEPAGGILTVKSELEEPIHNVATRGVQLWKRFDAAYFSKPRGHERDNAIAADRDAIIAALNADFQKPYFGRDKTGTVVDLDVMTYAEVLQRMITLMWVSPERQVAFVASYTACGAVPPARLTVGEGEGRWLDVTYLSRVCAFAQRLEERFLTSSQAWRERHPLTSGLPDLPLQQSQGEYKESPLDAMEQLLAVYPPARDSILCEEDLDYFLQLCQTGGKPVNFIPVVDGSLSIWFKKDSLWYSEDLAGVPEMDAQRVVILQGPVAVRHTSQANEPVADILDQFIKEVQDTEATDTVKVHVIGRELGAILPGSSDAKL